MLQAGRRDGRQSPAVGQMPTGAARQLLVAGVSVKGESYVLIIDYIKYFTSDTRVDIQYQLPGNTGAGAKEIKGNIPIYSGIGVRIRAEFTALASNLNISGLPGLAAAASANQIVGRIWLVPVGGIDVTLHLAQFVG